MATMRITLNSIPALGGKAKGEQFTGKISLPTLETRPISITKATLHCRYVRIYNQYCYLSFACGTSAGATAVFESTDGSAKIRDVGVTFTTAGNLLAVNGQTITFTVQSSNQYWTGNFFSTYQSASNPFEFYIDIEYTVLESASTLSLNKTTLDAGAAITPTITAGVGAASHKIVWQLGNSAVEQASAAAWIIPMVWLEQMPSALSGTASAHLYTYNSAGGQIGGPQIAYFTVTCPASAVPTLTSLTAVGINQAFSLYLKGRSSTKLTMNGVDGAYGSTIARHQISGGGFSGTAATLTTGILGAAGAITFTATIWDTRGRSATKTVSIAVTDYASPSIANVTQQRCNASGVVDRKGTYARCVVAYTFSPVGTNAVTLKMEYKRVDLAEWTTAYNGTLASGAALTIGSGELLGTNSWDIRYTLSDSLLSTVIATYRIGTAEVFLHYRHGGKGLGVGAMCEDDNRIQLSDNWDMWHKNRKITGATLIPAYSDLNNYTTEGMYYVPVSLDAATIANIAEPYAFSLLVERHAGVKQTFTDYRPGNPLTYMRNYYDGVWGVWAIVLSSSDLPISYAHGGTNATNARTAFWNLAYHGECLNLDTAGARTGFYVTTPNTMGVFPASNTNKYGMLTSYSTWNSEIGGYVYQILRSIPFSHQFWQRHRNDAQPWQPWHRFTGVSD